MKQAVNKVEIEKDIQVENAQAISHSSTVDNVSSKKASIVQLDRNVSLSRYLEACGDCV